MGEGAHVLFCLFAFFDVEKEQFWDVLRVLESVYVYVYVYTYYCIRCKKAHLSSTGRYVSMSQLYFSHKSIMDEHPISNLAYPWGRALQWN